MKCNLKKRVESIVIIFSMVITMFFSGISGQTAKKAQAETADTASLRMLYTSDIHGQVTTVDYETGGSYNEGGLSKAATIINQARQEAGANNTMLFDVGDNLYDYSSDYIYDYNEGETQPVYAAIASMGYDAMTLGNHDFDYTLSYIKDQLTSTGLTDKVVLSNVKDANTGKSIWAENKIITRNLQTAAGNTLPVNIGIIGETVPSLSSKRTSYTGVLKTEDIVANATQEAAALKAAGADIVVALVHSGIGEENPQPMSTNMGYALTKVPGIDVILCGHKHANFAADGTSDYDSLPGVDTTKHVVNGKILIQLASRATAVGIADLKIQSVNGKAQIVDQDESIRKVTKDTAIDATVNGCMGKWSAILMADVTNILADMDSNANFQNYFGTMEDNGAVQLLNDIKITYGLNYINTQNVAYKDYPVISYSYYLKYGMDDGNDYIDIRDEFKKSNIYDLIEYKRGLYIYKITGAQLREWIEWTASAYETAGDNILNSATPSPTPGVPSTGSAITGSAITGTRQSSSVVNEPNKMVSAILNYEGSQPLQFALQEARLTNWNNFYVYDGIEYQMDTTQAPRYSVDGNKINDTHRVTSLTRNGVAVKDTDEFVMVGHLLYENDVTKPVIAQKLEKTSTAFCRDYVTNYIEQAGMNGNLKNRQDNNWGVDFSTKNQYLIKTGNQAAKYAESKTWISRLLNGDGDYNYYQAAFTNKAVPDTDGPDLNLASLKEEETNKAVDVAVQATDKSGIAYMKYQKGKFTVDSTVWGSVDTMTGKMFSCPENGIYSVLAVDNVGNASVRYIRINNINQSILEAPVVKGFSNRMKVMTGTAEPDANLFIEVLHGKEYKTTVNGKGEFTCNVDPQKAETKIFVYVVDEEGHSSARTEVTVKRTGPNKPTLTQPQTNSRKVSGDINDSYTYPVVIVDSKTVYVPNDGTVSLYKASTMYSSKYKIKKVPVTISKTGKFSFMMDSLAKAKTQVDLKTVDALSRVSMNTRCKVKQTVPAKPVIESVTNLSKKVTVYCEEKCQSATIKSGKKKITVKKAKYNSSKKMYAYSAKIPRTDTTTRLKVVLKNKKGTSPALYCTKQEVVPNAPVIIKAKGKTVTGKVHLVGKNIDEKTVANTKTKVYVYVNNKKFKAKVKDDGTFAAKVSGIGAGAKVICVAKNARGTSLKRTKTIK